jgi:two-component system, chemotaxis family, protein-glutamate methylesterase/glutaminase
VQDPKDALYPGMPLSALEHVEVDYCLPVLKMGAVLYRLSQEPPTVTPPIPEDLHIEVNIAENPADNSNCAAELGESVSSTCPECGGPLWELRDEKLHRYRCRIGHAFTAESLLAGQSEVIEYALWAAVRTMEDRVRILMTLADGRRARSEQNSGLLRNTSKRTQDAGAADPAEAIRGRECLNGLLLLCFSLSPRERGKMVNPLSS